MSSEVHDSHPGELGRSDDDDSRQSVVTVRLDVPAEESPNILQNIAQTMYWRAQRIFKEKQMLPKMAKRNLPQSSHTGLIEILPLRFLGVGRATDFHFLHNRLLQNNLRSWNVKKNDDDEAYKEVEEYFNLKEVPVLPLNTLRIRFGCTPLYLLELALSVP